MPERSKRLRGLEYHIYRAGYRLLGHLPWFLIDGLTYFVAAVLFAIVGYRRRIVDINLKNSFPEKTDLERRELAWLFYLHLSYQFISTPKMLYQDAETIVKEHLELEGMEGLREEAKAGAKAIILLLGHCGNWEVFTASNLYLKPFGLQLEQLYRRLSNEAFDAVQLELRTRFGAITTPKGDVGRRIISAIRQPEGEGQVHVFAFIADQKPGHTAVPLWTTFLNQRTPWVNGAERLARKYNLPVYYVDVSRIGKRKYRGEFICITHNGAETENDEITSRFAELLEESIKRDPSIWLWSHKRWKHNGY